MAVVEVVLQETELVSRSRPSPDEGKETWCNINATWQKWLRGFRASDGPGAMLHQRPGGADGRWSLSLSTAVREERWRQNGYKQDRKESESEPSVSILFWLKIFHHVTPVFLSLTLSQLHVLHTPRQRIMKSWGLHRSCDARCWVVWSWLTWAKTWSLWMK